MNRGVQFCDQVADDRMIAAFVRAEFDSARFGQIYHQSLRSLGGDRTLIDAPDTADNGANEMRRSLLRAIRGYGANQYLFAGWPPNVEWWRCRAALDELGTYKYAHYQTWADLSGGRG